MSLTSDSARCPMVRRRDLAIALVAAALVLAGTAGCRFGGHGPVSLPSGGKQPPAAGDLRLVQVPGGTALVSARHGPARVEGGLASGFSHDELGAVIAASNIAVRVSVAAGPAVFEPTIARQCYGEVALMLDRSRRERLQLDTPANGVDAVRAAAVRYRVIGGNPDGEWVVVSLLADTEQARRLDGLARLDVTLRWIGGDWRLRVPTARPLLTPTGEGYTTVGGP